MNTNSLSYKYFSALLHDNDVEATEEELLVYAEKELDMKLKAYPKKLKECLPSILVAFMQLWQGWGSRDSYSQGKFTTEHYFVRFNKHMVHKTNAVFNQQWNMVQRILDECTAEENRKNEQNVTNESGKGDTDLPFSPFAVKIQCPPAMLNTLVFDSLGETDLTLTQHLGSNWDQLSHVQLLNWPFIEVRFRNADMHFVRSQQTEFVRYLNIMKNKVPKCEDEHVIEEAVLLKNGNNSECYTVRFIQEYLREYLTLLKTKNLDTKTIEEYHVLLAQFLDDVKQLNVNQSIATNTKIRFKLSPIPYIRNKKVVKDKNANNDTRVGYCEVITPKVELVLFKFQAEQNMAERSRVTFHSLEKMRNKPLNEIVPKLLYRCTFCDVQYPKKSLITLHLNSAHRTESHVRCTICMKQFDVMNLAGCRWRHKCTSVVNPAAVKRPKEGPIVIDG